MATQADKVREALKDAMARGWERIPASPGCVTLRWTEELPTPENVIEYGWWPCSIYEKHTFVTFIGVGRISAVANTTPTTPWTGRRDQKVSVKRALELLASFGEEEPELAAPVAEAPAEPVVEPAAPVIPEPRREREPATWPADSVTGRPLEDGMTIRLTRTTVDGVFAHEGRIYGVMEGGLMLNGRQVGGDSIHSAFATGNQAIFPRSGATAELIEILEAAG